MSYSYTRFRRALAAVRFLVGLIFVITGSIKLFDPTFFTTGFIGSLTRMSATTAEWYSPVFDFLWGHAGWSAVLVGMVELFLGIALVLGLATRPACCIGMIYVLNKIAITWYPATPQFGLHEFIEVHLEQLTMFFLFVLFAAGHAGETWGLGAIYHHRRFENQRSSLRDHPEYSFLNEPEQEEELQEETAATSSTSQP